MWNALRKYGIHFDLNRKAFQLTFSKVTQNTSKVLLIHSHKISFRVTSPTKNITCQNSVLFIFIVYKCMKVCTTYIQKSPISLLKCHVPDFCQVFILKTETINASRMYPLLSSPRLAKMIWFRLNHKHISKKWNATHSWNYQGIYFIAILILLYVKLLNMGPSWALT